MTEQENTMIPKRIWQTYRSRDVPPTAAIASRSWLRLNPDWEYHFCDDQEIAGFIDEEYGGELALLFHSLPLGVMKADVWRYAVLYKHGGLYTDIDTTCLIPLRYWQLGTESLLVALEDSVHFCQWTIAAAPGHAVLGAVLRLIQERARSGIDTAYEHFVHKHTGPGVWTEAVRQVLGTGELTAGAVYEGHLAEAAAKGILILPASAFNGRFVSHAFGSRCYCEPGYVSWTEERARLTGTTGCKEPEIP